MAKKKTLKQIQAEIEASKYKKRDANILKSIQGEISLNTKKVKLKNRYNRKIKHKNLSYNYKGQ